MFAKHAAVILSSLFFFYSLSCEDKKKDEGGENPPPWDSNCAGPLDVAPVPAATGPQWHPNGQIIGFNYTPLDSSPHESFIHCGQFFNLDSSGFWLINADGTGLRRALPFFLYGASWSPDGQWIAFSKGGNLYKMQFDGQNFDINSQIPLTTNGSNYYPSWSPDNQWIAYWRNLDHREPEAGIWYMDVLGANKNQIYHGAAGDPGWHASANSIIYIRGVIDSNGRGLGDSLYQYFLETKQTFGLTLLPKLKMPTFSPRGNIIAFRAQYLWLIDSSGSNPRQLTSEPIDGSAGFSFSPDGQYIVYSYYSSTDWTCKNGTLWIINIETGEKRQLTFNCGP